MKGPKKTTDGRWKVDERPYGREGRRFRKTFDTKADANVYFKWLQAEAHHNKEWNPDKDDDRCLSELATDWFDLHGHTLKSGKTKKEYLDAIIKLLNDPLARKFTATDFLTFRKKRLEENLSKVNRKVDIKESTVNYDLTLLKGMFNTLINLDNWKGDNPLAKVKKIKIDDKERGFLELDQINTLLTELDKTKSDCVTIVAKICLSTGARWGEAQGLSAEQVRGGKITFLKTKTSKMRTVPISKELEKEILEDRPRKGPLFNYCYKTFLRALKKTKIKLPDNQASHVLRHTFASQFVMAGGNLVTLSKILGHATIQMTMRYAHLSPEHLDDALDKNPMALIESKKSETLKKAA